MHQLAVGVGAGQRAAIDGGGRDVSGRVSQRRRGAGRGQHLRTGLVQVGLAQHPSQGRPPSTGFRPVNQACTIDDWSRSASRTAAF